MEELPKDKFSEIKPGSLLTLKLHNGQGRPITYRCIYVSWVNEEKDYFAYDTATGCAYISKQTLEQDGTELIEVLDTYKI